MLSGFFGGSYDIAQAATADISLSHQKARNMGWITLEVAAGIILVPLITSFTASSNLVSWFTIATPFWVAFCLAMMNAVGVRLLFNETYQVEEKAKVSFFYVFKAFSFVFADARVRKLGLIFSY